MVKEKFPAAAQETLMLLLLLYTKNIKKKIHVPAMIGRARKCWVLFLLYHMSYKFI
jgi:hypothetical protein